MRVVQMLGCIVISMLITQLMLVMQTQKIAYVDVKAIESHFIRQLAEHQVTEDQAQIAAKKFKTVLQRILQDYSIRHHTVLLAQNVLAGSEDMTQTLEAEIAQAMRSPA